MPEQFLGQEPGGTQASKCLVRWSVLPPSVSDCCTLRGLGLVLVLGGPAQCSAQTGAVDPTQYCSDLYTANTSTNPHKHSHHPSFARYRG